MAQVDVDTSHEDFEAWWRSTGSRIPLFDGEDVARAAWEAALDLRVPMMGEAQDAIELLGAWIHSKADGGDEQLRASHALGVLQRQLSNWIQQRRKDTATLRESEARSRLAHIAYQDWAMILAPGKGSDEARREAISARLADTEALLASKGPR